MLLETSDLKRKRKKKLNTDFFEYRKDLRYADTWPVGLCDKSGAPRSAVALEILSSVAWVDLKFPIHSSSLYLNYVPGAFLSNIGMATAVDETNTQTAL